MLTFLLAACDQPQIEDDDYVHLEYHNYADWSSDGDFIVYQRYPFPIANGGTTTVREPPGIYILDIERRCSRLVLEGYFNNPSFSPDGEWITFGAYRNIFKVDTSGANIIQLRNNNNDFFPVWSPTGEFIAYDNTSCGDKVCGIYMVPSTGGDRIHVMNGRSPCWSPDGQYLYSIYGFPREIQVKHISSDSIVKVITTFSDEYTSIRYITASPNGASLLITYQAPGIGWSLGILDLKTESLRNMLSLQGWDAEWSPDGNRIAYTNLSTGFLNIYDLLRNEVIEITGEIP